MLPLFLRVTAAVTSAATISLCIAPLNLAWLNWFLFVPMFWALRDDTPRSNRVLAGVYGVVAVGLIFRWLGLTIMTFSNLGPVVATLVVIAFAAVFGTQYAVLWSVVHPLRRRLGRGWILALPAAQVLIEFVTMHVFLFPYAQGVTLYRTPYVWQLASVTGASGLSYLLLVVNCSLAEVIYARREGAKAPMGWLAGAAAAVAATFAFGAWRHASLETQLATAPVLNVGVIQTDLPMSHIFSPERYMTMFPRWLDDTNALIARTDPGDIDLVVWSEGVYPGDDPTRGRALEVFGDLARRGGFELLLGGGTDERHTYPATDAEWDAERARDPDLRELRGREEGEQWRERYNSVYLFGRDGQVIDRYDKTVPLPFGEYLPLASTFPILREWIKGPGDFRAGRTVHVMQTEGLRIATPICYEAILPYVMRRYDRPDLIVNPTNDGWFAIPGPQQHAMLAMASAVELGVPVVRAAYNGESVVVEPHGDIILDVPPMEPRVAVVPVRLATFPTLYARWGDWFTALCALGLSVALGAAPWLRRHQRTAPHA